MRQNLDKAEILTIQSVSQLSGISAHTIRIWERRYGALTPIRTDTGRRLYNTFDLEKLKLLKEVTATHPIGQVATLTISELKHLAVRSVEAEHSKTISLAAQAIEPALRALEKFEAENLARILEQTEHKSTIREFTLDFVSPLLSTVGAKVSMGQLNVAHEHLVSALLREQLGRILYALNRNHTNKSPSVALSTPEGDLHEFGILISAVLFALNGYRVYYFGPNLPAESLGRASKALRCAEIVLGCVLRKFGKNPDSVQSYLRTLREHCGNQIVISVGGNIEIDRNLKKEIQIKTFETLESLEAQLSQNSSS